MERVSVWVRASRDNDSVFVIEMDVVDVYEIVAERATETEVDSELDNEPVAITDGEDVGVHDGVWVPTVFVTVNVLD